MSEIHYLKRTIFPAHIAFTNSKRAFRREVDRLKLPKSKCPYPKHGAMAYFFSKKGLFTIYVITIAEANYSKAKVASLIAHEAAHVVRAIWDDIGEKEPGDEANAYLTQYIVHECLKFIKQNKK